MAEISDEAGMRARQMYADGETVAAIRSETKLKLERIYYWVDGADGQLPALPRRLVSGPRFGRLRSRTTMVARMLRAAERQLTDIEQQLAANDMAPAERERNKRSLTILVRTMRQLTALNTADSDPASTRKAKKSNDRPVPRNIDELRRELARRVDLLRRRRADTGTAGGG